MVFGWSSGGRKQAGGEFYLFWREGLLFLPGTTHLPGATHLPAARSHRTPSQEGTKDKVLACI